MKKIIALFSVLFLILSYLYYRLSPVNAIYPISITFMLFVIIIRLIYYYGNKNCQAVGRTKYFYVSIVLYILLIIISIAAPFFMPWNEKNWMGIVGSLSTTLFYFCFLSDMLFRLFKIVFTNDKVVIKIKAVNEKWSYNEIQKVSIEDSRIGIYRNENLKVFLDVKLTERQRDKIVSMLEKRNVNVVVEK